MESHVVSTLTWKTNFQVHQWLSLTRKPHPGGHTGLGASLQGIRNAARTLFLLHGCLWIFRVAKAMTPHSSALAWKIPWTEEPGRLQSMGSRRVWTRLSDFTFTFHFHALEKEMATHSSVLAWRIPGTGEPGGLLSVGLHRVRHKGRDLAAAAASDANSFLFFLMKWHQPAPHNYTLPILNSKRKWVLI